MKSPYKILKLKSGEEIITRIMSQEKGKFIIERPMIFRTLVTLDRLGNQREITVLRNWLQFTDEIITEIPKDYVASFLIPDKSSENLYNIQKERDDTEPIENKLSSMDEESDDLPEDFLKSLGIMDESDDDYEENWPSMFPDPGFIIDSIIQGMIESGDMERILKQFKKRKNNKKISDIYTGDDIERDDFGNLWTDWSIDPDDYLG